MLRKPLLKQMYAALSPENMVSCSLLTSFFAMSTEKPEFVSCFEFWLVCKWFQRQAKGWNKTYSRTWDLFRLAWSCRPDLITRGYDYRGLLPPNIFQPVPGPCVSCSCGSADFWVLGFSGAPCPSKFHWFGAVGGCSCYSTNMIIYDL